MGTELSSWI